jgi:hypothetical protein
MAAPARRRGSPERRRCCWRRRARCGQLPGILAAVLLAACAGTPDPVLYPNAHLQTVGPAAAAAGTVRGAIKNSETSPVYKNFVQKCLRDRGYAVIGWQ